jgi:hypothetical protein
MLAISEKLVKNLYTTPYVLTFSIGGQLTFGAVAKGK